ncbi:uncharacterized protein [Spinacia oleracea]|uniref:Uncharacterized protein isoform X2 n=1 Tax=Spinacia oleracea TaxID=3562 RepID=A0ABM3R6C1_SPIOL|nr:uncharacterized protein LOC130466304 isoform X2 [Spinacia oleracea]
MDFDQIHAILHHIIDFLHRFFQILCLFKESGSSASGSDHIAMMEDYMKKVLAEERKRPSNNHEMKCLPQLLFKFKVNFYIFGRKIEISFTITMRKNNRMSLMQWDLYRQQHFSSELPILPQLCLLFPLKDLFPTERESCRDVFSSTICLCTSFSSYFLCLLFDTKKRTGIIDLYTHSNCTPCFI